MQSRVFVRSMMEDVAKGLLITVSIFLKYSGERTYLQIHDPQPYPVQHLILESKAAIWAILVAAAFFAVDGLSPMHLSVSIRPGKIIVGEL